MVRDRDHRHRSAQGSGRRATSSVYLAAVASAARRAVTVIDADPQASAADWLESSDDPSRRKVVIVDGPAVRLLLKAIGRVASTARLCGQPTTSRAVGGQSHGTGVGHRGAHGGRGRGDAVGQRRHRAGAERAASGAGDRLDPHQPATSTSRWTTGPRPACRSGARCRSGWPSPPVPPVGCRRRAWRRTATSGAACSAPCAPPDRPPRPGAPPTR